jgi:hypothetical protein
MPRRLSFLRRPSRFVVDEPDGRPFGLDMRDEPRGWMVTAYDADGRRLGRSLRGMSSAGCDTLRRVLDSADDADLARLADVWVQACRHQMTNAQVLARLCDAADELRARPAG